MGNSLSTQQPTCRAHTGKFLDPTRGVIGQSRARRSGVNVLDPRASHVRFRDLRMSCYLQALFQVMTVAFVLLMVVKQVLEVLPVLVSLRAWCDLGRFASTTVSTYRDHSGRALGRSSEHCG